MKGLIGRGLERPPQLDDHAEYSRTNEARLAANRKLAVLEDRWRQAQQNKKSHDLVVRCDAEIEERNLEIEIRRARADAERAREIHEPVRREAQQQVNAWHLKQLKDAVPEMLRDLAAFRDGPYAIVQRRVEAAIAAGVPSSTLPLAELSLAVAFARVGGDTYVDRCVTTLKKWIE